MAKTRCKHGHSHLEHPQCYTTPPEKIGFFDIETSNLNADFGIMLSYAIKEWKGKTIGRVIRANELKSPTHDKKLVEECLRDMRKFDRVIGYYSTNFDIPYVRSRAMRHNLSFPVYREVLHTDVFYWVKSKMNLHRKRLQVVCDFLGIPSKGHAMNPNMWTSALTGDKKSLEWIWVHNVEDVESLEKVYERLLPFTANRSSTV